MNTKNILEHGPGMDHCNLGFKKINGLSIPIYLLPAHSIPQFHVTYLRCPRSLRFAMRIDSELKHHACREKSTRRKFTCDLFF